ncbi:DUF551 domain-containing protein [Acinetobacter radioresistens]|uniref:DUF551 domain-containing protein n=1 Tax=Acinetobacter radioresistens TaxID=40216 RepID=UPI0018C3C79C|nr:DUF551 domain-containing protein [Acinetobacter radioresistens]MBA5697580.1 hypothetical protein [Acinetobacter radioresistens]
MEWISVEDKTPLDSENVIAFHDWGDHQKIEIEFWSNKFSVSNGITHWMPLPEPPKN